MNEVIKKLKKLIYNNKNKKILILSTIGFPTNEIKYNLDIEIYSKVFDDLLIENFGYIDPKYIKDDEKKRIEDTIEVKKDIPLFSNKILNSDIIAFLYINPNALRILCLKQKISYNRALNMQNKLIKDLKNIKSPIIKINLYSKNLSFDNIGRNVYIYNDYDYGIKERQDLIDEYDDELYFRFPYVKTVNNINDLKRKQGFLLIINENNLEEKEYINIDKKYRKLFSQFNLVYIITEDTKKINMFHIKYSNIYFVNNDYFDDDSLMDIYYEYILNNNKIKFSNKKMNLIKQMHAFLKNKKTIKTNELVQKFHVNIRTMERYMNDYNKIYNNIGYDYCNNEW